MILGRKVDLSDVSYGGKMKIWAELPQEPLGQLCNYCFLSLHAREGPVCLYKESVVE